LALDLYAVWSFYWEFDAALRVFSHVKLAVIEWHLYPIANRAKQEWLNFGSSQVVFHVILLISLFFVAGLSIIFVFLGVTASSQLDEIDLE
jgi:cytochrome c biogenesis protein CcdA